MNYVRECSDDEVVAEFLRAEIDSVRFGLPTAVEMVRHGATLDMLRYPDLTDEGQNATRKMILSQTRGWGTGTRTFTAFPADVRWHVARLDTTDLSRIYFAESPEWRRLSGGSCRPIDVADRIAAGTIEPAIRDDLTYAYAIKGIEAVGREAQGGATLPPPILLTSPGRDRIWLLEGYTRLSGFLLAGEAAGASVIVGEVEDGALDRWERIGGRASLIGYDRRRSLRRIRLLLGQPSLARRVASAVASLASQGRLTPGEQSAC